MKAEEACKAELRRSDIDHHTPVAGAMVDHIIANLLIHTLEINQARFFARGSAGLFLKQRADEWVRYEQNESNQLNQILVNNDESIPTTTNRFKEYTMLEENGASKYKNDQDQLFALIRDSDAQILFITKAITLTQKETWPELSVSLVKLLAWIKEQIRQSQNFLGHELREKLYTEEDDDGDGF